AGDSFCDAPRVGLLGPGARQHARVFRIEKQCLHQAGVRLERPSPDWNELAGVWIDHDDPFAGNGRTRIRQPIEYLPAAAGVRDDATREQRPGWLYGGVG